MRINPKYRMERITDDPKSRRPALEQAWLCKTEKGDVLTATNGHAIAVVPVSMEEGDTTGSVCVEALKAARKNGGRVRLTAETEEAGGLSLKRFDGFSSLKAFENPLVFLDETRGTGPVTHVVTLNAALLHEAAQAMGSDILTLRFYGRSEVPDPHAVMLSGPNGERGALMPLQKIVYGEDVAPRTPREDAPSMEAAAV